jgi:hypothetical protein
MSYSLLKIGIIALRLYRNRHIISGSGQSITMAIRVMVFSVLGALALGYVFFWCSSANTHISLKRLCGIRDYMAARPSVRYDTSIM